MEPWQLEALARRWADQRHKFFLLPLIASDDYSIGAYERCHLVDPFGKDSAAYANCYARLGGLLERLVAHWPR
jgi:hypothetical protein